MADIDTYRELITKGFSEAEIPCEEEQAEKLALYMERILGMNEHVNLTAITEPKDFVMENLVDSASIMKLPVYRASERIIDVGTGAGLPGMVLAILSPEKDFTLLDSLNKRIDVLRDIREELGLSNVTLIHGRAEDLGKDPEMREQFDLAVSRAVAELSTLLEYCLPFVSEGGSFIAYKGGKAEQELKNAGRALNILGGNPAGILHAGVPGTEHRLVVIKKMEKTPQKYPRKAGTPTRKPL